MSISDNELKELNRPEKLEIIRTKVKENLHLAYQKSSERYNKRARIIKFKPGQEVYRRNIVLSDFSKNRNSKFCKKFLKCRIVKPVGENMYELETMQGKSIGIYHVKDIQI